MNILAILVAFQVSSCTPVDWSSSLVVGDVACAFFNGPSSTKYDVVFVGDGFTSSSEDSQLFLETVKDAIDIIAATSPYESCAFNFYWVRLVSNEAGADHPLDTPATCRDTPLNSQFGNPDTGTGGMITVAAGADRILYTPTVSRCYEAADLVTNEYNFVVVLVNDTTYGGRAYPEYDVPVVMVSRSSSLDQVLPHELAHALAYLGDEYDSGGTECTGASSLAEPEEPNLTRETARTNLKWPVASDVPIPTTIAGLMSAFPTEQEVTLMNTVGVWEGANGCPSGFYRPQYACLMKSNYQPFCEICDEQIRGKMRYRCPEKMPLVAEFGRDLRLMCIPGRPIRVPLPACPKCPLAGKLFPISDMRFLRDDRMRLRVGPMPEDSHLLIVDQWSNLIVPMHPLPPETPGLSGEDVMFEAEWGIELDKNYFVEFVPKRCPVPTGTQFSIELLVNGRPVYRLVD